ncbi:hypothetical protein M2333_000170 [Sphingobium sp. B11D3B]|uniref:hypothetical protein n=1 Tax=Sphingobium sp. B11D3B TaxID=2940575 RepID=UPI002227C624|nr:hypothetical protein [Sphingobium sp. B11D3B]MCW2387124.1 hypothetical protein [Sphingobium sp. B11D3B]
MKGYIYISSPNADPERNRNLNDPIFRKTPTLGGCMPPIRRLVRPGDYVFVISGATRGVQQYVVGGFEVAEKIDALAAYNRFPENRLQLNAEGKVVGNVLVDSTGKQHPLDTHSPTNFASRIENYLIGVNPVALETPAEVARGRSETLDRLSSILEKRRANRVIDVMGRWARLDQVQIEKTLDWLQGIKQQST